MMRILRNPDVLWREESLVAEGGGEDEAAAGILFADGQMVSLNEMGLEIWKVCDGLTEEEIVARLLADFEVSAEVARQDLQVFLADLAGRGFIRYG